MLPWVEDMGVRGYGLVEPAFAIEFSVSKDIEKGKESLGGLLLGSSVRSLVVGRNHAAVVSVNTCGDGASGPR